MAQNNDGHLFDINDGWRLCADKRQWILERFQGGSWRALYFISSNKGVLVRLLVEEGVEPSLDGQAALATLPTCFRDSLRERSLAA